MSFPRDRDSPEDTISIRPTQHWVFCTEHGAWYPGGLRRQLVADGRGSGPQSKWTNGFSEGGSYPRSRQRPGRIWTCDRPYPPTSLASKRQFVKLPHGQADKRGLLAVPVCKRSLKYLLLEDRGRAGSRWAASPCPPLPHPLPWRFFKQATGGPGKGGLLSLRV